MTDNLFEKAFGVYVGPATQEEVVRAIGDHRGAGAELVLELTAPDGGLVWHKTGYLLDHAEGPAEIVFIIGNPEEQHVAGNPLVYVEPPLVLSFSRHELQAASLDADRYSSGVRLRLGSGPLNGHTLTIAFWQSIQHETESGDVAPGLGEFRTSLEEGGAEEG